MHDVAPDLSADQPGPHQGDLDQGDLDQGDLDQGDPHEADPHEGDPHEADPGHPTVPDRTTAPDAVPALPEATFNATGFEPANPVEEDLLQAARSGQSDRILSTLLLAKVLLPDWSGDERTFDPADVRQVTIDDAPHVLAFTSAARLRERLGEEAAASWIKFTSLIAAWPGSSVSFAVNPGTPVGAAIPGEEILALANWAAELGLGREPEPEPVKRTSPPPRPAPSSQSAAGPLLMQKPISPEQLSFYLDRGYDRVSGFVYRAGEVAHLRTPDDFYRALGLHYSGSAFKPDAAEIYLLRWVAARVNLYRIPYGGQHEAAMRAMEGWVIERPPFRGNGFAPSDTGDVIAEFKVDSARLPHGAQLWRADRDGNEHLVAVLDADGPRWQPVDAP